MPLPLVATKLTVPLARSGHIHRPALQETLSLALERKLTILSAPAGFGKTSLLSAWAQQLDLPVAWLSLDEGDQDATRFWSHLLASLASLPSLKPLDIERLFLPALQSHQPQPPRAILISLINSLTALEGHFALVLDDLHLLTERAIHTDLLFLLEHMPTTMHVIVATRADPPWPLGRLRASQQLVELRADNLRFSIEETTAFFQQASGTRLPPASLAALAERTEGWITGLQIAALSMQDQDDITQFIEGFTGGHRYLLDYLSEEVIDKQPEDIQRFLLDTAILTQLNASLCNDVTGRDNSQALLEQLEHKNLFIVPLDEQRAWYRYHQLFADLLRKLLLKQQPDRVHELHLLASQWYERHNMMTEAVRHALASENLNQAAKLLREHGFEGMQRGEVATVMNWLDALPENMILNTPLLLATKAWGLMFTGKLAEAEALLNRLPEDADDAIQGYRGAMLSFILGSRGEIAPAIDHARIALERLPRGISLPRAFSASILSSLHRVQGNFPASLDAIQEAVQISGQSGDEHMVILAKCNLAGTLILQGRLQEAAAACADTLAYAENLGALASKKPPYFGYALTALAAIQYEHDELDAAEETLYDAIQQAELWDQREVIMQANLELVEIYRSRRDLHAARRALDAALEAAGKAASWSITPIQAANVRLLIAAGRMEEAARAMETMGISTDVEPSFHLMIHHLTLARLLLAQGNLQEAGELLNRLYTLARSSGALGYLLETRMLQVCVSHARGDVNDALHKLSHALELAEDEAFIHVFVEQDSVIRPLLQQLLADRPTTFAARVMERLTVAATEPTSLVEPLTSREEDILRLLAAGYTNPQIAETLVIAVGTVKKHTSNIYAKLDVRTRTQAVLRARELKLID